MLRVEGLRVSYGAVEAVKGLDLDVGAGEIVALIGANGAGKSTTLMAISGATAVSGGYIRFRGTAIEGRPASEIVRLGIAHVPEGRRIFKRLTVLENLQVGAYTRRDRREVEASLEGMFGYFPALRDRRGQQGGTLSGGEQQMLAIGRALMANPTLLLLDEPSLGLAPLMVERIFDIIRSIHRSGTTMLLVEQNARTALGVADRAYVVETGRIVLHGPASALLDDPKVRTAYLGEVIA
ncbi:MAG: ABC transporter ATP-binding protein [Nitrospirae bacterium]|nr:ABC transporter ATP-binding protein [Nitrospirota bacterium]